jgi:hypothetical protein
VVIIPLAEELAEGIATALEVLFNESLIFNVGPAVVPAVQVTVGVTREVRPVPPLPTARVPVTPGVIAAVPLNDAAEVEAKLT